MTRNDINFWLGLFILYMSHLRNDNLTLLIIGALLVLLATVMAPTKD